LINCGNGGLAIFIPKKLRDEYGITKESSVVMVQQDKSIKFIVNGTRSDER